MKRPLVAAAVLLAWVCLGAFAARAEQSAPLLPPRDIWPQATAAIDQGDIVNATKQANALIESGKASGTKTFPLYAESAAAMARRATLQGNARVAEWGYNTASQLDPRSPGVAFIRSDLAGEQRKWPDAVSAASRGFANTFANYRSRLFDRSDILITIILAMAATAVIFAIALFVRYGKTMAHDFREMLSARMSGGTVSVLAFALLFLPIFLWLGPMWLIFYWFIIFFGYANAVERGLILVLSLLLAAAPVALDLTAAWIAGVDSPVMMAAVASEESAYRPDALRRLQEVVNVVPDDPMLHILLGNLYLQDVNERQAEVHYRRSNELHENAGAHVNLGNLHFFAGEVGAAISEYERAEELDRNLAIAFYNHSVAAGSDNKFDVQAQKLDQAKRIDRSGIEKISSNPPPQLVVMYHPPLSQAWTVAANVARRGAARALFGNWAWFDPTVSVRNPLTVGGALAFILAPLLWLKRRRAGFAGACIKCGRTFCHRCKSARESATYCTQCIHIYLKRDGVSLDTKRTKLEEVSEHHTGLVRRNKWFAVFLPGSAQLLEGRTSAGVIGSFAFAFFVLLAVLVGRLAPVLAPGEVAKLIVRVVAVLAAVIIWFVIDLPVFRRKAAV
jgi:tetratricopeptide (TPR) repeat protein